MRAIPFVYTLLNHSVDYFLFDKLKWKDIRNDLGLEGRLKRIRALFLQRTWV